jgi:DNA-binding CsgD family transcriptional regulator
MFAQDVLVEASREPAHFLPSALHIDGGGMTYLATDVPDIRLTPCERRVLHEIVGGRSRKAIAQLLGRSIRTVDFHIGNLHRKAGTGRLVELALWGADHRHCCLGPRTSTSP